MGIDRGRRVKIEGEQPRERTRPEEERKAPSGLKEGASKVGPTGLQLERNEGGGEEAVTEIDRMASLRERYLVPPAEARGETQLPPRCSSDPDLLGGPTFLLMLLCVAGPQALRASATDEKRGPRAKTSREDRQSGPLRSCLHLPSPRGENVSETEKQQEVIFLPVPAPGA